METHRQRGTRISMATRVNTVAFTPDGNSLVSGDVGGSVVLWDVDTHQPLGPSMKAVSQPVTSIVLSADGKRMTSGMDDGTINIWMLDPSPRGTLFPGNGFAFTPDGTTLALGAKDGTVALLDIKSEFPVKSLYAAQGAPNHDWKGTISILRFSPDGKILAGSDHTGALRLWE